MKPVLAIVHPTDLVGEEVRGSLGRRRDLWREVRLLSTVGDEIGALTEIGGAAAMVVAIDDDDLASNLAGVDAAFFCGPIERNRPLLAARPAGCAAIVLSSDATPADGHPVVAAINLETVAAGGVLLSPHPGVVMLANLLYPLRGFGLASASATLLQPISVFGKPALEEVLDQTRNLLRFAGPEPREIFPAQLAFNLLPAEAPLGALGSHLEKVLGSGLEMMIQLVQAPVFHSYAVGLSLRLAEDPGLEAVRRALGDHPANELAVDPELLGPIDAAAREEVLIGPVRAAPGQPGGYLVWAVMDNLTCGGASNALRILEALGFGVAH